MSDAHSQQTALDFDVPVVKRFTCVSCPQGCELEVTVQDGQVLKLTGNACPRGEEYGRAEAISPQRVLTSLVSVRGSAQPGSCRTERSIPKELIPQALAELRALTVEPPVRIGDVVLADVCGTGVNVIATRDVG